MIINSQKWNSSLNYGKCIFEIIGSKIGMIPRETDAPKTELYPTESSTSREIRIMQIIFFKWFYHANPTSHEKS